MAAAVTNENSVFREQFRKLGRCWITNCPEERKKLKALSKSKQIETLSCRRKIASQGIVMTTILAKMKYLSSGAAVVAHPA